MSTTTKCFLPAVLAVTALLNPISARTAGAQVWSKVAAGCVVDSASAAKADLNSGFGTVSFKGTKTGRIRLTCPISGTFGIPGFPIQNVGLSVSFYDGDGRATGCAVRASLLRSNLDAHEGGLDIVNFDSNSDPVTTEPATGRRTGGVFIPETLNLGTSYYWVQLELVRSSTACNPVAVGVFVVPFLF